MNIPVFHDDQHGTAIIAAAVIINAAHLTGRDLKDLKMVLNRDRAASVACTQLAKSLGARHVTTCRSQKRRFRQARVDTANSRWSPDTAKKKDKILQLKHTTTIRIVE